MPAPIVKRTQPTPTAAPSTEETPEKTLPTLPEPPASEAAPAVEPPVSDEPEINWTEESEDLEEQEQLAGEATTVEGETEVIAATVPPTEPSTTAEGTPPSDTPKEPVAPEGTPEVTSAETPPVTETKPEEKQPPAAQPVTMTPEEALKWEADEIAKLEPLYKLSEEEANQLATEPELVMPKLAAVAHYKIARSMVSTLQTVLPQLIESYNTQQVAVQEARQAFYDANPDLADPKFEPAVMKIGAMYREVNPKAPRSEAVLVIGKMVREAMGIAAPVSQAPVEGGETPPVVPTVDNVTPITTPTEKAKPFVPARGGSKQAQPAAKPNQWEELFAGED